LSARVLPTVSHDHHAIERKSNQEFQRLFDRGFKVAVHADGSKVAGGSLALDDGTKHTDHFRDCLERFLFFGVLDDPVVLGDMRPETRSRALRSGSLRA
jgi:hypothetical protein